MQRPRRRQSPLCHLGLQLKREAMALRYMGFEQRQSTRVYKFDSIVKGEPTIHLAITADLTLFHKYQIGIQEGPGLCAEKLAADVGNPGTRDYQLTVEDLAAHATAKAAAVVRQAELRRMSSRRRGKLKPTRQTP